MKPHLRLHTGLLVAGDLLAAAPAIAQNSAGAAPQQAWNPQAIIKAESFVKPPAEVERIVLAPRTNVSFSNPSPDRKWFLRTESDGLPTVEDFGKPHLYLGGLQVDESANRARSLTTRGATGLTITDPRSGTSRSIETPRGARVTSPAWSPDGRSIGYVANFPNASHLYVADVASGKSTAVTRTPLLATLVTGFDWTADGRSMVAVLVPDGRGPAPVHGNNGIEDGPQVRLTEGRKIPQRIHASLLADPHEKAQLRYHTTGQLALIDVRSRAVRKIGAPAMIRSADVSPDGQYVRVTQMVEPFSYLVPVSSFGSVEEIWDLSGKVLATVARTPLREGEVSSDDPPAGGAVAAAASDTGRRNVQWDPRGPGLTYLRSVFPARRDTSARPAGRAGAPGAAGAAGGAGAAQPTAVRLMRWLPPFGPGDTALIHQGSGRFAGIQYSDDAQIRFITDSGMVHAVRASDPSKRYLITRSSAGGRGGRAGGGPAAADDTTAATAGTLVTRRGSSGAPVVMVGSDGRSVFLAGNRAPRANWEKEGPRAWVDRLDFETGQRTRVFDAPSDAFEQVVAPLDDDYTQFIYTRESPTLVPDSYLRDTRAGSSRKITNNVDVAPAVSGAQRRRLWVTRPRDNFRFLVNVTLPANWTPGTRLPGIIWFYPSEFTSQRQYDDSKQSTNINRFPAVGTRSAEIWVTQGYAVLQPDNPIVGEQGRMNDNYTQDLKENLDVTIDAAVEAGFLDRNRVGIGGHSYGAFSTVNAMTLTPYFKAGIAGDGMYNRSLTPFSFQSERRSFFEVQDMYLDMSPFYRADKLSGALLMYHGMEDQNVGTAPISSIRMMHALQGLGKTASLYMYPYEDHGPATDATNLDLWARWIAWFDIYVKNARTTQTQAIVP